MTHGLPEVNVNTLIGSDRSLIEPVSGMHRMTGNQVQVTRAKNIHWAEDYET